MIYRLAFLFCLLPAIAFAKDVTLNVCTHIHHQPPYYLGSDPEMPPKGQRGIFPDALDQAADQLKIKINWHRLPWKRCLAGFEAKTFDALLGAIRTDERAKLARFPEDITGKLDNTRAMSPVHYHLYENRNNPLDWKGGFEFGRKNFSLGAPRGYIITQILQDKNLPVTESLTPMDGFEKLTHGHLTGYVFPKEAAPNVLSRIPNGLKNVRRLDPVLLVSFLHLPILHDVYSQHPALFERLWFLNATFIQERLP